MSCGQSPEDLHVTKPIGSLHDLSAPTTIRDRAVLDQRSLPYNQDCTHGRTHFTWQAPVLLQLVAVAALQHWRLLLVLLPTPHELPSCWECALGVQTAL